jgi:DNA-binding response OmpR family regulator
MILDSTINKRLDGRKILVAEDDTALLKRLVELLASYTGKKPTTVNSAANLLSELQENGAAYDAAVIDVMLPQTEADFEKMMECRQKLDQITSIFRKMQSLNRLTSEQEEQLEDARDDREFTLNILNTLVDRRAGVRALQTYLTGTNISGQHTLGVSPSAPAKPHVPVLFLTAVGNEEAKNSADSLPAPVHWLVKPVSPEVLLNAICALLTPTA